MIQWEYKIRVFGAVPGSVKEIEFLCEQGKEGWELCGINQTDLSGTFYYFKRQITENK